MKEISLVYGQPSSPTEDRLREIREIRLKNAEFFEKHFTYISAGSTALVLNQVDKLEGFNCSTLFSVAVLLLSTSLFLNLYSYLLAVKYADQYLISVPNTRHPDHEKNNSRLSTINYVCLWTFGLGMFLYLTFIWINI